MLPAPANKIQAVSGEIQAPRSLSSTRRILRIKGRLCAWAISTIARISVNSITGLPMVSINIVLPHHGDKGKHLPLHRYRSPALLLALDSLNGDSKQLGHLLLCLVQFFSEVNKLFAVHGQYQEP